MTATDTESWLMLMGIVRHREWGFEDGGDRIRDIDGFCPVCSIADELGLNGRDHDDNRLSYTSAALWIGAPPVAASQIASAGDNPDHHLRPTLMAALGMTEQQGEPE